MARAIPAFKSRGSTTLTIRGYKIEKVAIGIHADLHSLVLLHHDLIMILSNALTPPWNDHAR